MNTLESLRATLDAHAQIADPAAADRGASIHRRIQVVRRRRRTAAAVGAVVAVLVLVAGVALPSLAHRSIPALPAATTVTAGGFEYRLVRVVETKPGDPSLEVGTPRPGAREAFALLARGLHGGTATLRSDNVENRDIVDRIVADGANPAVPIASSLVIAGTPGPYRLTLAGGDARTRVGVAIYRRTSAMPAGVLDPTGHVVFRRVVGSRHLLAAAFARPGQAQATFRFTGRVSETALEGFCGTNRLAVRGPRFLNVSIDGDGPVSWAGCVEPTTEDAASGGFFSIDRAGGDHVVRVWTSRTSGGPPQAFAGVVLGGAAYDDAAALIIDGNRVDPVVEDRGRTWTLDREAMARHRGDGHTLAADVSNGQDPVLFGFAANHVRRMSARSRDTIGDASGFRSSVDTPSTGLGPIGLPLSDAFYRLTWPVKDKDAQVTILVYRPAP